MASKKDGESDGGSISPSECSDAEEQSERDSDYESEDEAGSKSSLNIKWIGCGKKIPVILFNPECIFNRHINMRTVGERYHMAYKFGNSECKVVRDILSYHGFHEVHPNSSDYNIVWTGAHLKPFTLRALSEFQKINHFPRSYELTRKDRLYKNIQKMQQIKGVKNFDIVPASYVLPGEYQEFCAAFLKDKGPWIVKPVASSRGRGIFLVSHPDQIPLDDNLVVCKYLSNPLLIDGFKFDVRLYVAVTSYDPLQIYLYEEGLTRFATVKYEKSLRFMRNQCMHLTNYSINKKNEEYVRNDDADIEDYGNKWSLGAMLRYLRSNGKDTAALMMKIEDCIIKAIISVELPIATACKMFMPFRGNCFELYGFDILIDENMKPWVLEVNLSPSLACDSPLDLKIKGHMLCDLFSMSGIICHDPMMRTLQQSKRNQDNAAKMAARAKSAQVHAVRSPVKQRPSSAGSIKKSSDNPQSSTNKSLAGLNTDEIRVVRRAKEEASRKGGWVRIFPTADTWDLYSQKGSSSALVSKGSTSIGSRAKSAYIQLTNSLGNIKPTQELAAVYASAMQRTKRYERKLGAQGVRGNRKRRNDHLRKKRRKLVQGVQEESGEENENEGQEEQEEEEPPITERNISERNNPLSKQLPKHSSRKNSEDIQIAVQNEFKIGGKLQKKPSLLYLSSINCEASPDGNTLEKTTEPESAPSLPPEPKFNVVDLLKKGHSMSKVQARTAFAMYLGRVQQRLMADDDSLTPDDTDGLNEQMDLVLRFLKRAAANLQQPFKVIVPSRKLPVYDRRRILAKQLGDFVHIYNKDFITRRRVVETDHWHSHNHAEKKQKHLISSESTDGLDEEKFDRFMHTASEGELEDILTTYTKINKSTSVFLGAKSPSEGQSSQHAHNTDIHSVPTSSSDHHRTQQRSSHSSIHGNSSGNQSYQPAHNTSSANSYANAVQIYTQKLSTTLRPKSATSEGQKSDKQLRSRPSSAHMSRPMSFTSNAYNSTPDLQDTSTKEDSNSSPKRSPIQFSKHFARNCKDPYNERLISEALQRLTMRQQARQYSSINGLNLVPSDSAHCTTTAYGLHENAGNQKAWSVKENNSVQKLTSTSIARLGDRSRGDDHLYELNSGKCVVVEDNLVKSIPSSVKSHKHVHSAMDQERNKQTNVNLQKANATFDTFIEDSKWQNELAMAYSQVTGVTPQNYHTPTPSSKQYQILQQQAALKQQNSVLLEQSKARHQALVAQAHAVQKSMLKSDAPESETVMIQMYAPKPPIRPGTRKAASAFNRIPRKNVPEETNLNLQFCTSTHPDVNGGW